MILAADSFTLESGGDYSWLSSRFQVKVTPARPERLACQDGFGPAARESLDARYRQVRRTPNGARRTQSARNSRAITQRLARLDFRSAPGEAYQCTLVHYFQERLQLLGGVNVSTTHAAIEGGPMIPLPPIVAEHERRDAEGGR